MKYDRQIVLQWFADNGRVAEAEFYFARPEREHRFDFAWPEVKVALEAQGGMFSGGGHVRGNYLRKEIEKRNLAAVRGWVVLYCLPEDLCMSDTFELIDAAIVARLREMHGTKRRRLIDI